MLFVQNFSIEDGTHLNEFLEFKNTNLPTTKLRHEPVLREEDGSYHVSICSDSKDIASLEVLFNKWAVEAENSASQKQQLSLLGKFFMRMRAV